MSPMSLEQPEQSDRPDLPASSNPSSRPSGPILFNSIIGSWLVVNTVGFAIATALMASVFWFPSVFERPQASVSHVSGFVVGVILGPLQAIVLRRKVPKLKGWQWMLAGILGSYLGVGLGWSVILWMIYVVLAVLNLSFHELAGGFVFLAIFGAAVGACVGLVQVLVLGKRVRGRRRWWVASVIGRSLGWLSAQLVWQLWGSQPPSDVQLVEFLIYGAIGGLVYGVVTAQALPHLNPHPRSVADHSN